MKYKIPAIFLLLLAFSCGRTADKPANLVPKDKMAEILAEFAVYSQAFSVSQNPDTEAATLYILKKQKITAKDFRESYTYYLAQPGVLQEIYAKAQEKILETDPKLQKQITEDNTTGQPQQPAPKNEMLLKPDLVRPRPR